jgi:hypothetical protein
MDEHRSTILIIASVVLVAGLIAGWAFVSSDQPKTSTPLTEISDTATIQNSVQLSHLSIATSENYFRHKIYVISGHLKNVADKPLRMVQVKMTFTDFDGKPIHEYSEKILEPHQKPLEPLSEFRFEVRQENLPRGWNYRVPITEITQIGY